MLKGHTMLRTATVLCSISLAAASALAADHAIHLDKLTKAERATVLSTAKDDTLVEANGETKTVAQWRLVIQAKFKPIDPNRRANLEALRKAHNDAAEKALEDQQNALIAAENAKVDAEFEQLKSH